MPSNTDLTIANVICGGIILIALVLPLFLLSRLFKIEHDEFHDQWERDGRPNAMPFWFPPGELHLSGFHSYPWFMGYWWLLKTPDWIKRHETGFKLLRYYRVVSFVLYGGLFGACVLVLFALPG